MEAVVAVDSSMSKSILATKLYLPRPRSKAIRRPHLIARLNEGLHPDEGFGRKLTLLSAAAGFGKTTLVSEWIAALTASPSSRGKGESVGAAWLSLDERDNDLTRFLAHLVGALQTVAPQVGQDTQTTLQAVPPPAEAILTTVLNDLSTLAGRIILVLDDYHAIDAQPVDRALAFLLQHLPPQMHLVIATREDPQLPLARLRARGQLTELRAADLRFTTEEAAEFLNQVKGLNLSAEAVAALETRTEGWIAGLHLAAISMQGQKDTAGFIKSFTGSHHFVLDYLLEEVLHQQSESVQSFLLRTSILDRLCGSLCDAVMLDPATSGQETLEYLERANLFIVSLDNERRWYRYHHLFGELLRQRLQRRAAVPVGEGENGVAEFHIRASQWYEDNGLEIEAFHHAVAAHDLARAARLVEGKGMPLQFRGALTPVLNWLASLPATELDARPSLWVMYASALSMTGQLAGVEPKLQAAEAALQAQRGEPDAWTRNLIGHIAAIRALLAAVQNQVDIIIDQSRRALEYLHPDNLAVRTATIWKLGIAYQLQGDRAAAGQAYAEAVAISRASGNVIVNMGATTGLGNVQESQNELPLAAETYWRVLKLAGDAAHPGAAEAQLGLARIFYQWNDLEAARQHGQQSLQLARLIENTDRFISCEVLLARVKLAEGDVSGAAAMLARTDQSVHQHNFVHRLPEVAAARVQTLLRQGDLTAAARLAAAHELPLAQARVHLAQGDAAEALALLEPLRRHVEARNWHDERLKVMLLQALALHLHGERDKAPALLGDALVLAEPGGFVRIFVDEGAVMVQLLSMAAVRGVMPDYAGKLLAALEAETGATSDRAGLLPLQPLIEPLSEREREVLALISQGLSNREIGERLFLALDTVKGHTRRIYGKLQVRRRTEAVARARELGLL
jgi:LuxR family maltose regulon positive regulatory protein